MSPLCKKSYVIIQTNDRKYRVTIEFEIGGELPSFVDEDYLVKDILDEIQLNENLGEVEIWGEAFGDYDDVWAYFLHNDLLIIICEMVKKGRRY